MARSAAARHFESNDVAALLELARAGTSEERREALIRLALLRPEHAVDGVADVLERESDPAVRRAAAQTLGAVGGERASAALSAADASDAGTRTAIAEALGMVGGRSVIPALEAMLRDAHREVRAAAAEALRRVEPAVSVDALSSALRDDYWPVRRHAREALRGSATPAAAASLRANPRRAGLLRAVDMLAVASHARRAARSSAGRRWLHRLPTYEYAIVVKSATMVGSIVALELLVVGASPLVLAVGTVVVAVPLALVAIAESEQMVTIARNRAVAPPSRVSPAPWWRSAASAFSWRPIANLAFIAVPLGIDAVLPVAGIAGGLAAGGMLTVALGETLSAIAAGEASSRDGRDIVMELRPGGFECNQFFWA